ncbi:uncharacterized protein EV420DRAFT_1280911 [Desarmillaria tabescens]|uniref:Uncharacterized protein n=1 Tax=Armillaria tabescens TaxID=1929756 RepID=A0AA39J870_ARMTA|nr:uncharacterized protein EV420DRAFT_1280911 [Desarmillaria tabescens]KAK0436976.1 hypothetical protein EV420DRAFT_1280911 [Desarmillaria tabescens]
MCINGDNSGLQCSCFCDAIPYRPMGFQLELLDYTYYIQKRSTLLEDPAIARAALMHGGLIWHITMEHVQDPEFILSGLGGNISRYGECHRIQGSARTEPDYDLWEETLTEDQIDLLCGVYRVYRSAAGSAGSLTFTQDLSWFPRQCSFRNSSLDLGHWSPDAEDWYQCRVQMYLTADPKGQCLNQAEWKSYIHLWQTTVRTYKGIEVVSKAFLNRHFLQHV